jgi:hypothetical protein
VLRGEGKTVLSHRTSPRTRRSVQQACPGGEPRPVHPVPRPFRRQIAPVETLVTTGATLSAEMLPAVCTDRRFSSLDGESYFCRKDCSIAVSSFGLSSGTKWPVFFTTCPVTFTAYLRHWSGTIEPKESWPPIARMGIFSLP